MKKQFTILLLSLTLGAVLLRAQTVPINQPLHLDCTSPQRPTLKFAMDLDKDPFDQVRMLISQTAPAIANATAPTVMLVEYPTAVARLNVLTVPIALDKGTMSVQFTVSAFDAVAVERYLFYVDGQIADQGGRPGHVLGPKFAVRWNEAAIAPGQHVLGVVVVNSAGLSSPMLAWTVTA